MWQGSKAKSRWMAGVWVFCDVSDHDILQFFCNASGILK